jgi:hypothetical protein
MGRCADGAGGSQFGDSSHMSDLWITYYEQIAEDFTAGRIDEDEARARMKKLGFDADEIDEHLGALKS